MGSAAEYAYLDARVTMMAGKLLSTTRLQELIANGKNELPNVLVDFGANSDSTERPELDRGLAATLLSEVQILMRPVSGPSRDILAHWAHRFELANLKTIVRGVMANQKADVIESELIDLGPFTTLPLAALLRSDDITELLRNLEHTPYADIAHQTRRMLGTQQDAFALDAALDRRYFLALSSRAKAVGAADGHVLRSLVGSIVDRVNLVWLLRYRFVYRLPPPQAYFLLIPSGYRLNNALLLQLSQCDSQDQLLQQLPDLLRERLSGCTTIFEITQSLEKETWEVASRVLGLSTFNIGRALAYLVLRERDLRRLRAVARGQWLGVSREMILTAVGLQDTETTISAGGMQ